MIRIVFTWWVSAKVVCSDGKRRPHAADEMRDDTGHQRGKDHRVIDPSEIEHFDPEQRSRDRRAEHRCEAGADAANHQPTPIFVAKAQDVGEQTRQRGANLRGRALLADGSAKRQRHHRRAQLHGRDEPIDATGPLVHGGDDRLRAVAAASAAKVRMIQTQIGSATGRKMKTGTLTGVSARTQSAERSSAQRNTRVPRPTQTPAMAPSIAHLSVLMSSAVCSVYQRVSSESRGDSSRKAKPRS